LRTPDIFLARFRESVKGSKKTKAATEGKTADPKAASTEKVN